MSFIFVEIIVFEKWYKLSENITNCEGYTFESKNKNILI